MYYMIHTCNERRWYVNKFLIPSMLEQGIRKEDITVAVDTHKEGNLLSTMKMFDYIARWKDWNDITWHLQDDIVLSKKFKERTESLYGDVMCGFCSKFDYYKKGGLVDPEKMWFSFPCIGIKNKIAKDCADWFFQKAVYDDRYKEFIKSGKHDDDMFREFLKTYSLNIRIYNVIPNLVDHVDYLLGGSLVNPLRAEKQVRSLFWNENSLNDELSEKLKTEF